MYSTGKIIPLRMTFIGLSRIYLPAALSVL